jgi:hypothetical protein
MKCQVHELEEDECVELLRLGLKPEEIASIMRPPAHDSAVRTYEKMRDEVKSGSARSLS